MRSLQPDPPPERVAALLRTEFLVPVDRGGTVRFTEVNGVPVVPAFASYDDLPDVLPPDCARYAKRSGHLLAAELPPDGCLYQSPANVLIPVERLLAPTRSLLAAASARDTAAATAAFRVTSLYCEAAREQVFLARDDGAIPVFSTLRALRHAFGPTRWFALTGAEFLDLLPEGHHFVLDPLSPHETTFHRDP